MIYFDTHARSFNSLSNFFSSGTQFYNVGKNRWGDNDILCQSSYKQPDFADGKIDLEKVQFINIAEVRLQ